MALVVLLAVLSLSIPASPTLAADGRTEWCGRLSAFAAPTAAQAGSMQIGARVLEILPAPTATFEKFPAQTLAGLPVCLAARSDAQGRVIPDEAYGLGLTPMPPVLCGLVVNYSPPSTNAAGQIRISGGVGDGALLLLSATGKWPASLTESQVCVRTATDTRGLAVATDFGESNAQPAVTGSTALPNTGVRAPIADWNQVALAAVAAAMLALVFLQIRARVTRQTRREL